MAYCDMKEESGTGSHERKVSWVERVLQKTSWMKEVNSHLMTNGWQPVELARYLKL